MLKFILILFFTHFVNAQEFDYKKTASCFNPSTLITNPEQLNRLCTERILKDSIKLKFEDQIQSMEIIGSVVGFKPALPILHRLFKKEKKQLCEHGTIQYILYQLYFSENENLIKNCQPYTESFMMGLLRISKDNDTKKKICAFEKNKKGFIKETCQGL